MEKKKYDLHYLWFEEKWFDDYKILGQSYKNPLLSFYSVINFQYSRFKCYMKKDKIYLGN